MKKKEKIKGKLKGKGNKVYVNKIFTRYVRPHGCQWPENLLHF
jgi:hypothetical protein